MNHYEALSIPRDATQQEIKDAWRRASSAAHPDREGGSTERQQAVNKAYEVLGDPERRMRYDQTGEEAASDSIEMEAKSMLVSLFTQAMEGEADWLQQVSQMLGVQRAHLLGAQATAHTKRARLMRRAGKIKTKKGENLVQMLIDDQLRRLDAQRQAIERGLKVNAAAAETLANYEGGDDPVPAYGFATMNTGNQSQGDQMNSRGQLWAGLFGGQ